MKKLPREHSGATLTHGLTDEQLRDITERATQRLLTVGLPKSRHGGARLEVIGGEPVARAYRHSRLTTYAALVRGSNGWRLLTSRRVSVGVGGGRSTLRLTDNQLEYLRETRI